MWANGLAGKAGRLRYQGSYQRGKKRRSVARGGEGLRQGFGTRGDIERRQGDDREGDQPGRRGERRQRDQESPKGHADDGADLAPAGNHAVAEEGLHRRADTGPGVEPAGHGRTALGEAGGRGDPEDGGRQHRQGDAHQADREKAIAERGPGPGPGPDRERAPARRALAFVLGGGLVGHACLQEGEGGLYAAPKGPSRPFSWLTR